MTTEELQQWWDRLDEQGRVIMLSFDPHGEVPPAAGAYTNRPGAPTVTTVGFTELAPRGDSHYLEPAAAHFLSTLPGGHELPETTVTPMPTSEHTGPYSVRLPSGEQVDVPNLGGDARAYLLEALAHGSPSNPTDHYAAYRAVAAGLPFGT
ncbi:hypothetical protein WDZ16_12855 [Pseudokineococcus marinus]|uniref:Uncharacterized protein n=1 Tax=Pseudokineococcus marinus TaxID=351215 RepID=A0A849BLV6_9ACTN|nr:hypothetical protein [Pseudokineococcus marinus]NNH21624.1 hypothetical protein [Pseudokineococcus marinus]